MTYRLTVDPNVICRLDDGYLIPIGHRWWTDYEAWLASGNAPEPVPAPSMADAVAMLSAAIQAWLDSTAQANGYDSLASCISYRGSAITQWNDDALAALAWRDAVWVAAFQWQQDALANPPATLPDASEVIASLPQPEQFGWVTHVPGATG